MILLPGPGPTRNESTVNGCSEIRVKQATSMIIVPVGTETGK